MSLKCSMKKKKSILVLLMPNRTAINFKSYGDLFNNKDISFYFVKNPLTWQTSMHHLDILFRSNLNENNSELYTSVYSRFLWEF